MKIRDLERKQRRQRQQIFDAEDDILDKRDELISLLPEIINSLKNHCHPDNKVYTKFNQLLEGLKV